MPALEDGLVIVQYTEWIPVRAEMHRTEINKLEILATSGDREEKTRYTESY